MRNEGWALNMPTRLLVPVFGPPKIMTDLFKDLLMQKLRQHVLNTASSCFGNASPVVISTG